MDYNSWYKDDEENGDALEDLLLSLAEEEDYFSEKDIPEFFNEMKSEDDFLLLRSITQEENQHKESKLQDYRQHLERMMKSTHPHNLDFHEKLTTQIKEIVNECESFLLQRRIPGSMKYASKRIIFPGDLPYLSHKDYAKVVRLMTEGNAVLDMKTTPVDYLSACALLDLAMPSSMEFDLVKQFSVLPFFSNEKRDELQVFSSQINFRRLGVTYYLDTTDKMKQGDELLAISSLMASSYFQNPEGKQALEEKLRNIRFKTLLSPQISESAPLHWKAELLQSYCYLTGIGRMKSELHASDGFKRLANNGNAEAQYSMGMCYLQGIGVKESAKNGYKWIKKAHEAGYSSASYELAFCYLYGRGITRNPKKMLEVLTPFIEKKEKLACFIGSLCYSYGIGAPQDIERGQSLSDIANHMTIDDFGDPLKSALYDLLES